MKKKLFLFFLCLLLPSNSNTRTTIKCLQPIESNHCNDNCLEVPKVKQSNETLEDHATSHVRVVRCSKMFNTLNQIIVNVAQGGTQNSPFAMKMLANLMGLGKQDSNKNIWTFSTKQPTTLLGLGQPASVNNEEEHGKELAQSAVSNPWQLDDSHVKKNINNNDGLFTRILKPFDIFVSTLNNNNNPTDEDWQE